MPIEPLERRVHLSAGAARAVASERPLKGNAPTLTSTLSPIYFKTKNTRGGNSASATPAASVGSTTPSGLVPSVVRGAYGLGSIEFAGGVTGNGAGQTIAIVDAYDDPNAFSDLNNFSNAFSLPQFVNNTNLANIDGASGPTFTKVSQTGSTTALPGTDPKGAFYISGKTNWEQEEALDVEWAHVMAPQANIVLIECNDATDANLLTGGVGWARAQAGIDVVSMSFSGDEGSGLGSFDTAFTTPINHLGGSSTAGGTKLAGGITFLAATGDHGIYGNDNTPTGGTDERTSVQPQFPADSRFVVAVGGTRLYLNSGNTYNTENAWGYGTSSGVDGGGGGGIAAAEDSPTAQQSFAAKFNTTKRTYPDLAMDADPSSGVPIYDTFDYDSPSDSSYTPWIPGTEGGTSLATPLMAGIVAVADQGRALKGVGSLDGINDVLPKIYSVAAADYHDVTYGTNGPSPTYSASAGYDLETGRGSPVVTSWIRDVAGVTLAGNVTGRVFLDNNGNNTLDAGDNVQANITVYADANNNNQKDAGELSAVSDTLGYYTIAGIPADTAISIRATATLSNLAVLLQGVGVNVAPAATGTANFAYENTAFTDAADNDNWLIAVYALNVHQYKVSENGILKSTLPDTGNYGLQVTFTGANDNITIDNRLATIASPNSSYLNGAAGKNDSLTMIGSTGDDLFSVNGVSILYGRLSGGASGSYYIGNFPNINVEPLGGTNYLEVDSGTVHIPSQAMGGGILTQTFSTLDIEANAKLVIDGAAAATDRTAVVLTTPSSLALNATGTLDLGSNDMIIKGAGSVATVDQFLKTGNHAGAWNGVGIASAAAASNSKHNTAIGAILNGSLFSNFDGVSVGSTDALLKYTFNGDTDFNGKVNADDYARIDSGYQNQSKNGFIFGWATGDFDYSGKINADDYALIDSAYQTQAT